MRAHWISAVLALVACTKSRDEPPAVAPPPPKAVAPIRGVAGDGDVRVLLAEVAAAKACDMVRGKFRELRSAEDYNVVTGVLWIHGCEIDQRAAEVTFHLAGSGWQWADQTKKKAGGTFVVRQYVRFGVTTSITGALDIAYAPGSHVVSMYFTPNGPAKVDFKPVGEVEVDRKSMWSSIVGAIGSVFADSPEEIAHHEARGMGKQQFIAQLSDGMAVTIDLCTGLQRFNLGRPSKGKMQPPDAGEAKRVPVVLHPGGLVMFGPEPAPRGFTLEVSVKHGPVRASLVCARDAELLARTYVDTGGEIAKVPVLAAADTTTGAKLRIKKASCPVVMVARSLAPDPGAPVEVAWRRPQRELARALGGPVLDCKR
jgi:hypothetical protein